MNNHSDVLVEGDWVCSPWLAELMKFVRDVHRLHTFLLDKAALKRVDGSCLYASLLLQRSLVDFVPGCRARIRGGGDGDGGCKDLDGVLRGHYWVEGVGPDGLLFIADITSAQFGHAGIFLGTAANASSRYIAGDDDVVSTAAAQLLDACLADAASG
ncbi:MULTISPECIES: hypothetical protein [Herbaspirillum]|uniref:Uncharacterized protein n=2 Tax=Herbaspirillum huttiense TaxID=863372 RepID=A0AAJ2HDQ6_9BURK|nr:MULTISPECIES: hypothetical protein [Herbaspirillum]MDR9836880.1 hypothetical protein [Herbaspirillum huttiense]